MSSRSAGTVCGNRRTSTRGPTSLHASVSFPSQGPVCAVHHRLPRSSKLSFCKSWVCLPSFDVPLTSFCTQVDHCRVLVLRAIPSTLRNCTYLSLSVWSCRLACRRIIFCSNTRFSTLTLPRPSQSCRRSQTCSSCHRSSLKNPNRLRPNYRTLSSLVRLTPSLWSNNLFSSTQFHRHRFLLDILLKFYHLRRISGHFLVNQFWGTFFLCRHRQRIHNNHYRHSIRHFF